MLILNAIDEDIPSFKANLHLDAKDVTIINFMAQL